MGTLAVLRSTSARFLRGGCSRMQGATAGGTLVGGGVTLLLLLVVVKGGG